MDPLLKKYFFIALPIVLIVAILMPFLFHRGLSKSSSFTTSVLSSVVPTPVPQIAPPTPSPPVAPKIASASATASSSAGLQQLSFTDSTKQFGPCAVVPTLMYHHIQAADLAKAGGYTSLTVNPQFFSEQMQYLKDHQYTVIKMQDLVNFFNNGTALPKKPVLISFDDAYEDFDTVAVPVLNQFQYPATMFVPTGLIENPNYLTWSQMQSIAGSGRVLFANHTWSHRSMGASNPVIEKEITTADAQLHDHGYDSPKIFAYPYGTTSPYAISFLGSQGYQVAFTTKRGSILCKGQRLTLPRMRIGNAQLNLYGL